MHGREGSPGAAALGLRALLAFENAGVLRVLCAPAGPDAEVRAIALGLEDLGEDGRGAGTLLLAVGAGPGADVVREAARRGACAVVVAGAPDGDDDRAHAEPLRAARETGTALLVRARGVDWAEVSALLRSALAYAREAHGTGSDPLPALDATASLTALAARVAASVGGSVTIEDTGLRVLAHSATRDGADPLRRSVILGGRVPEWRVAQLRRSGLLRRLWTSSEVLHRPASGDDEPERLVVAVRHGRELLGSIWAAADSGALAPDASRHLRAAAGLAAPLLVRERLGESGGTRLREAALRGLLHGTGDWRSHAWTLGLSEDSPHAVAVAEHHPGGDEDRAYEFLAREAAAHPAGTAVLREGGRTAFLFPAEGTAGAGVTAAPPAVRRFERLLASLPDASRPWVGIGPAGPVERAAESFRSAVLVVEALRQREARAAGAGEVPPSRCADAAETYAAVEVLRVLDAAGPVWDAGRGPVHDLVGSDLAAGGELVRTLRAYFDAGGDVPEAARRLTVHPNTLRYRIGRVRERYGVDLGDPDTALLAALAVRFAARRTS